MNGVFLDEIRPRSQCRIDRLHCDGPRFCACQLSPTEVGCMSVQMQPAPCTLGRMTGVELSVSSLSDTFPQSAWIEA